MGAREQLLEHLLSGATTTCRAWQVTRRDGLALGFTDHDRDLAFDGMTFSAGSGLSAGMLQRSAGLAPDNTEVVGALSNDAITEVDLKAGRYDGAEVVIWLVNWRSVDQRMIRFRGRFGDIQISQGEFRVDIRGLTDPLNHVRGSVYQPACSAVLGDARCKVDLTTPNLFLETVIKRKGDAGQYYIAAQTGIAEQWFQWGKVEVVSGAAAGLKSTVKTDRTIGTERCFDLMMDFNIAPAVGDSVVLYAGCDKTGSMCRTKFANFLNFRGFPHIPGNDWLASTPSSSQVNDGGSRFK